MRQQSWWFIPSARIGLFATLALYMLVRGLPIYLVPQAYIPNVILVVILILALHRPILMPFFMGFALGLLHDIISFAPLGLGAISVLLGIGVMRRYRQVILANSFIAQWLWVSGTILTVYLCEILLMAAFFIPNMMGFNDWLIVMGLNVSLCLFLMLCFSPSSPVYDRLIWLVPRRFLMGKSR